MKKSTIIYISLVVLILFVVLYINVKNRFGNAIVIEGSILLSTKYDKRFDDKITIYNYSTQKIDSLPLPGGQSVFWSDDKILFHDYDLAYNHYVIYEYNINTGEKKEICIFENIDYFTVCNNKMLSISDGNSIFLYDMEVKETKILVQDNNSEIHSWSDDGNILYYSDSNRMIKSFNTISDEIKSVVKGINPIVSGVNIAYIDDGCLNVKNMQTNEEYVLDRYSYDYCFSPDGNILLVESEMSLDTAVKNIFKHGIKDAVILGHSLVAWDYKNNLKKTIIDTCVNTPEHFICDWKSGRQ